jgi:hypothetical protein
MTLSYSVFLSRFDTQRTYNVMANDAREAMSKARQSCPTWTPTSAVQITPEVKQVKGVWIVWYFDDLFKGVLVAAFSDEIDALRYVNANYSPNTRLRADFLGYGDDFTKFVRENISA